MSLRALVYAYILGGLTFIPLVVIGLIAFTIYTSVPLGDIDPSTPAKEARADSGKSDTRDVTAESSSSPSPSSEPEEPPELPKTRKGWLTIRRTLEEQTFDGSYVNLVRSFLDARSKDPKRSRPRDTWYVVLKGKVLYLYEDETITECEAAIDLGLHDITIVHDDDFLTDGELFAKRNAICLRPKPEAGQKGMPSVTREMQLERENVDEKVEEKANGYGGSQKKRQREREREREKLLEIEKKKDAAREEALDTNTPWFIFVRSNIEMEDWYLALIHASDYHPNTPLLVPLQPVFSPEDMKHLVDTLDEQPDVIPTRWLNALIGRIFFSYYKTKTLEHGIIGKLMKKLSKVKRPNFLNEIVVTEVSVGDKPPMFSKPMLKELTKEGDAALEVRVHYKGEFRIQVEAIATLNLGARFKPYTVPLALAVVLRELEGNLVLRVKPPPSSRIWYAFTQMPKMQLEIIPGVSDRRITWSMILNSIESRLKEVIMESVVLPNMDDIAFFDSSPYIHRGGIFPDAARHTRAEDAAAAEGEEDAPNATSTIVETSPEGEATVLKRSHSDGEVQEGKDVSKDITSRSKEPPIRSSTIAPSQDVLSSSPSNDSNTWPPTDSTAVETTSLHEEPEQLPQTHDDEERLTASESSPNLNAPGTPRKKLSRKGSKFLETVKRASHSPSTRSRASSRSPSPSPSVEYTPADTVPPVPPIPTSPSIKSDKSSTTTFLGAFKSRAADKQVLGQTAKEAMRKWGVNWPGTKKENGSVADDASDAGSSYRRGSSDSTGSPSSSHKHKANYAEVMAHVAERREKVHGFGSPQQLVQPNSSPIAIPDRSSGKERTVSMSSQGAPSIASLGGTSISSMSSRGRSRFADENDATTPLARSTSRPGVEINGAPPDKSADSRTNPVDPPPAVPIHTQPPQARTMTIPGIHASHRGEVMSMGYVPPSPPPPPSEPKTKPTGIQSLSRLFNRGPAPTASESASVSHPETGDDEDLSSSSPVLENVTSSDTPTPIATPVKAARPTPPPLPPRTSSNATLSSSRSKLPPVPPSLVSASESLRSIATRDDERKRLSMDLASSLPPSLTLEGDQDEDTRESDGEGVVNGSLPSSSQPDITYTPSSPPLYPTMQKPPLPPRRPTATAST